MLLNLQLNVLSPDFQSRENTYKSTGISRYRYLYLIPMRSFSRSHKITIVGGYLCSHWSEENTGIKQIPIIGIKKITWGTVIFCEDRELRCIYLPNLNLNFNSTQKDEETELHTTATADKEVVDVQLAVKDENPIAVVLDQEIDALQINYTMVASDIKMDKAPIKEFGQARE